MRDKKDVMNSSTQVEKLLVSPAILELSKLSSTLAHFVQPQINANLQQVQTMVNILRYFDRADSF